MLKRYKIGLDSEVYAVSLVENPAIEENFVYFSQDERQALKFQDDEKHVVLGPVMIPNKPIYRYYKDQEFEVVFEPEVIEQMAFDFLKNKRESDITLDHETDVNEVSVVESWLKTSESDKSNAYGYNLPIGTWFVSMKVNNIDLWQKIKSGEVKGFSIESLLEIIDSNFSKMNKDDKNETFFEKLKNLINDTFNTTTSETTTSEEPASTEEPETVEPHAKTEEPQQFENETPAQPETTEVVEPTAKTAEVQTTVETPVEEHQQTEVTETVEPTEKTVEAPNYEELYNSLKEENASTSKALEEIKKQVESLKAENETLKGRPSAEPVKPTASGSRSFGETHDILRKLYERSPIQ